MYILSSTIAVFQPIFHQNKVKDEILVSKIVIMYIISHIQRNITSCQGMYYRYECNAALTMNDISCMSEITYEHV